MQQTSFLTLDFHLSYKTGISAVASPRAQTLQGGLTVKKLKNASKLKKMWLLRNYQGVRTPPGYGTDGNTSVKNERTHSKIRYNGSV